MKTKLVRPVLVKNSIVAQTNPSATGLTLCNDNVLRIGNPLDKSESRVNLVLISLEEDEINSGDILFHTLSKRLFRVLDSSYLFNIKCIDIINNEELICSNISCHKVIVTQEQISPEYITKFVDQYNDGGVSDIEIVVEKDKSNLCDCYNTKFCKSTQLRNGVKCRDEKHYKPKLVDNFIIIIEKDNIIGKPLEDYIQLKYSQDRCMGFIDGYEARKFEEKKQYTEEEVKVLFRTYLNTKIHEELMKLSGEMGALDGIIFDDWFEEYKK